MLSMIATATSGVFFGLFEEKDGGLSQRGTITATACNFRFAIRVFTD